MAGITSTSSAGASFQGLPLSSYGYAPITDWLQTGGDAFGGKIFSPKYGAAPADAALGQTQRSAGDLGSFAGGFNPNMYGYGGSQDAASLRALAGSTRGMFGYNNKYAEQALQQAFDPQNRFQRQNLADLLEQSRLGQSIRGVAMTPYGAGAEANSVGRFLNDWRDRQINRMNVGSQTASTLQQQVLGSRQLAGSLYGQAGQLNQNALSQMLQAYGLKGDMLSKATQSLLGVLDALKIGQESKVSSSSSGEG